MSTGGSRGIFDLFGDLPLHPLINHVAIVMVPLAALSMALVIFIPRLRRHYLIPALSFTLVGAVSAWVARQSGLALQDRVGSPGDHAALGNTLTVLAIVLFFTSALWALGLRSSRNSVAWGVRILGVATVGVGVAAIVFTVLAGHSGAKSVWSERIMGTESSLSQESVVPPTDTGAGVTLLTLELVATKNTPEQCWSVIDGVVYDLSTWIDQHPGGASRITQLCGVDGTELFAGQHGGSQAPEATLQRYALGELGDPAP